MLIASLVISFGLSGCGGGGGAPAEEPPSTVTANAGVDQLVGRDVQVTLDGSATTDSAGGSLTYEWQQTRGTDVTD